jgi:hypothetical protein
MRKFNVIRNISFLMMMVLCMFAGASMGQARLQEKPAPAPESVSAPALVSTATPASQPVAESTSMPSASIASTPESPQPSAKSRVVKTGTIKMQCPSGTDKYCSGNNCSCWTQ